MKNKEKYANEIVEFTLQCIDPKRVFAIDKKENKIVKCEEFNCNRCLFNDGHETCLHKHLEWADSEYIKKYKLTENEVIELKYFKSIGYSHLKVDKSVQNSNRLKALRSSGEMVCYADLYNNYVNLDKSKTYSIEELLENHEVVE